MYIPNSFRERRTENLHALIQAQPLGLLITHGASGLQASPLPFVLYPQEGDCGVLRTHLARANPHWQELDGQSECLVMFQGENGYISPSWYPSKGETHRAVPTWNYIAVEARGTPSVIQDAAWLHRQLADLTRCHEGLRPLPWSLEDAPADYLAAQMQAIVGIEIPITHLEGKFKLSQNKNAQDKAGVIHGLQDESDAHHHGKLAAQVAACSQNPR